jgi:septum site-determining protein MinD
MYKFIKIKIFLFSNIFFFYKNWRQSCMGEVIVITSGKGGVGKTTTTANIGTGLALAGKKVVLIDTDIGLRNLDVVMGLENRIVYDLVDVVEGVCRVKQALIKDKRYDGLFLLPAAQTRDKTAVSPQQMINLVNEIKSEYDYIIIDCPAGIEQGFKNAIAGADRAIVVTTPEVSAVRDADRIIGLLEANELRNPKLLINRVRIDMVKRGDMMSIDDIIDILAIDLIGVVPDDEKVVISTNRGEPAVNDEKSLAGQAYRNITKRIQGEDIPIMNLENEDGFLFRFKKLLGFKTT